MEENKSLKKIEKKSKEGERKITLNQPPLLCAQSVALRMEDGDNDWLIELPKLLNLRW